MRRPPPAIDAGPAHDRASDLTIDTGGTGEIEVLPWSLLWRERMRGRVEQSDRRPWIVLVTCLFGLFAVGFTITVLAVSLEVIGDDLHSSKATTTWVITGPMLALAVFGPTWGKLADIHGARRVYLAGMSGAAVFAALTAIAWDGPSMVVFRIAAAAAGAAAAPASMALINTSFDRERRVQAMGYWSMVAALAPVVGVIAGAPAIEAFGWRSIFIVQCPLTALCVAVAFVVLPETPRRPDVRLDLVGAALVAIAAAALLLAVNRGPVDGWGAPHVVGLFLLAPITVAVFLRVERRVRAPLLPLDYLGERNFAFPMANQFFTNFAYMGGFIVTPLLLDDVFGLSLTKVGLVSLVRPATFAVAAPLAGWLAIRWGERTMGVTGGVLITASMVTFASVAAASGLLPVFVALALSGVGMGATAPAMAATIANAVRDEDLGLAGAAQQMVSTLGTAAGTQVLFTVQQARESAGLASSFHAAYFVGALAALLGVATAVFIRSSPRSARLAVVVDEPETAVA